MNKDAGQQQKGFRLQKLRAVYLLLKSLEKNEKALVYCSIENKEDINYIESFVDERKQYFEQDKAYDPTSTFTFNNQRILSTIANFIYCWIDKSFSSSVTFGFYATNRYGKEKSTTRTKKLNIIFPSEPIIKLLIDKKYDHSNLLEAVKKLVLDYLEGLPVDNDASQLSLKIVSPWEDEDWKEFLSKISWNFGQEDIDQLQEKVIQKIQDCSFYKNQSVVGKEEVILSQLIDLFDKRQSYQNPAERFIYGSDIKLAFLEVSSGAHKIDDPTWRQWESINASDSRGLEEKIVAVCQAFSEREIQSMSRKAAAGLILHQQAFRDKGILSVRYRVYQTCKDILDEFIEKNASQVVNKNIIKSKIEEMVEVAFNKLQDLGQDYHYPISNKTSVLEIMLELVDSCYLAFDEYTKGIKNEE